MILDGKLLEPCIDLVNMDIIIFGKSTDQGKGNTD